MPENCSLPLSLTVNRNLLATKNQPHPARQTTVRLGNDKETLACEHLQAKGLRLLTRNYRLRSGEIDLIFQDNDMIVFVEVRYRKRRDYGGALQSINYKKQQRIIRTAQYYLMKHAPYAPARFDVVAIEGGGTDCIQWIPNAFDAG